MQSPPFIKMHGLGNDFMVIDARHQPFTHNVADIAAWGQRRTGVGFDQCIILSPPTHARADIAMHIYNADGSAAGACGNATRCVADMLMHELCADACTIQTGAGLLHGVRAGDQLIKVDMGAPQLDWADIPLAYACDTAHLPLAGAPVGVSMGNPHCVFFVDDVAALDIATKGPMIERNQLFPQGVNVEFVQVLAPDHLRMRVWERGAGITQACGTGACASLVAGVRRGLCKRACTLTLDGGDLHIAWDASTNHVLMSGPVAYVYKGQVFTNPA